MVNNQSRAGDKPPRFFYGYAMIASGFLFLLITYGTQYSFGVFFKPVLNEFNWSRAETSLAYSLCWAFTGLFGIITGRMSDRFGPRMVISVCGLMIGLSYLLMSRISSLWQFYLFYGVLLSIGVAGWVPVVSTAARWFSRKRGLMTGIVLAGVGTGVVVVPPIANQLIANYSWRTSFTIFGVAALVTTVAAAQFMRKAPKLVAHVPVNSEKQGNAAIGQSSGLSLGEAVRTQRFWIATAVFFSLVLTIQTVMVHIVPYATDLGIPEIIAATILSVIGILSIAGKVGMGSASDRAGCKLPLAIVSILTIISLAGMMSARGLAYFYIFGIIFGIAYGGSVGLQSPTVAEFFGLKAHGVILGLIIGMAQIGGAIGPFVAGRIYDVTNSYHWIFIIMLALNAFSLALLVLTLMRPHRKPATLTAKG